MNDLYHCYEVLGLEPGASQDKVKEAFREMAFVWHPDRFPEGSKLQLKAQQRMKEINAAYQKLQAAGSTAGQSTSSRKPPPPPPPRQESKSAPAAVKCDRCLQLNPATEIYCQACGHELVSRAPCRHCSVAIPTNAVFCPKCGGRLR